MYAITGLGSDEVKLIEACLRCLRTIFESSCAPVGLICQDENLPLRLLSLIPHSVSNQVCVATILAAGCKVSGVLSSCKPFWAYSSRQVDQNSSSVGLAVEYEVLRGLPFPPTVLILPPFFRVVYPEVTCTRFLQIFGNHPEVNS
jgi:hypothetical protein